LKLNPVFAPLRNDERFKQIVARAPAPGAPTPPPPPGLVDLKSIAVLAFDNRSDDKSDDSFSDGMSEELLNMLAKVPGLTVKARNSSFYFKGRNATPQEIGRQLGVSHFVSGSVERMGNAVRIMAQLSRTDTGDMDWSERFMGDLSKPWELQERIAGSIAEKLKLKLGATMQARQTVNPEAYRLVLEGRHFWNLRTTDGFARAEADCIAALQLDPNFAPAHALLANVCVIRAAYRAYEGMGEPTAEDVARARVEAQKAIALDPTAADPVLAMAYALQLEGRLAEAEAEFRHAITLSPNYALAHHWLGSLLEVRGRLRECVAELERAAQLDPLSFILLNTLTRNLRHAQRYEEALAVSERSLALRSDFKPALTYHAQILLALGRREQAVEYARRFFTAPDSGPAWSCYAETILVLQQAGLAQEAVAFGEKSLGRWPDGSYQRGLVLAVLGRWDEAWPRMERTPLACCHGLLWLSVWDNMRDTPRFRQMLATIGCEAEYKTAREELARLINDRKARK
jgi:TolB-like protein